MISFIIPAHNEERYLGATLSALHVAARAVNEQYEIIVAEDASSDATGAVATSHGARVVVVAHRQIAATRNAGACQAKGDLFIFVDVDTSVSASVVRAALQALKQGAGGGGAVGRFDGHVPLYARMLIHLWAWVQRFGRLATGCFLFCMRRAFDTDDGFDETLYAFEDVAFSRRLRRLGVFVILRETVTTSGRNLRTHTGSDALRMLGALVRKGPRFLRTRRDLHYWYDAWRDDPNSTL